MGEKYKMFTNGVTHQVTKYLTQVILREFKAKGEDPKRMQVYGVYIKEDLKTVVIAKFEDTPKMVALDYRVLYDSSSTSHLLVNMPDMQYKTRLEHSLYKIITREVYRLTQE